MLPYGSGSSDRNADGKPSIHFNNDEGKAYYGGSAFGFIYDNGTATYVRNTLVTICDKVTLNVASGGTLEVSGELSAGAGGQQAGHTAGKYAELQLLGTAKVTVSGTAKITGFINNAPGNTNGSMTVFGGGTLYEPFILKDYKGGSLLAAIYYGMADYGYSPFSQFYMANVSVNLRMNYGASMINYCNLYAERMYHHTTCAMIGSGGFIELTDSIYSYLESKYDASTGRIKLNIYGGAKNNALSLYLKDLDLSINSTEFVFGISWIYDITLAKNTENTTNPQTDAAVFSMDYRYKLLPGARLTIEAGAQLSIGSLCVYDSSFEDTIHAGRYPSGASLGPAIFMVRGSVIANILAGNVYTDQDDALVQVTRSTSMTTYEPTVMSGSSTTSSIDEKKEYPWVLGLIYDETVNNPEVGKDYKSETNSSNVGIWLKVENAVFTVPDYYDITWIDVDGVERTTVGKTGSDRNVSIPVGTIVTVITGDNYLYLSAPTGSKTYNSYTEWQNRKSDNKWTASTTSTPAVYWVPILNLTQNGLESIAISYINLSSNVNSTVIQIVATKTHSDVTAVLSSKTAKANILVSGIDQSNVSYTSSTTKKTLSSTTTTPSSGKGNAGLNSYTYSVSVSGRGATMSASITVTISINSATSLSITGTTG